MSLFHFFVSPTPLPRNSLSFGDSGWDTIDVSRAFWLANMLVFTGPPVEPHSLLSILTFVAYIISDALSALSQVKLSPRR